MFRTTSMVAALLCGLLLVEQASAANAWFSLNLEFNDPTDFGSGGTWTVVAKADERGFLAIILQLSTVNFDPLTGFLTPPGLEVEESLQNGHRREIVQGDDLSQPTLDVGVIGGIYPSTYVDAPLLTELGMNPDLGSFSGGVELATGTFNPGGIPSWITSGGDVTTALLHSGFARPNHFINPTVFTTVRYVGIPEPSGLLLLGGGVLAFASMRRHLCH